MADQPQFPTPTPAAARAVLLGLAVLACFGCFGVCLLMWATKCPGPNRPDPPDPPDPAVVDDAAEAAETAISSLATAIPKIRRSAGRSIATLQRLLSEEIRSEERGSFREVNELLQQTDAQKFGQVFKSLATGFKRAADAQRSPLSDYAHELAENFSRSAKQSRKPDREFHDKLADANHEAADRLIASIVRSRDDRGSDGDDSDDPWGGFATGYLIDEEHREELRQTSTPLPMMAFNAPAEIDPRGWHRIENQQSMGSCQGHALSSVCEFAARIAFRDAVSRGDDAKIKSLGQLFERALALRRDDIIQFSPLFAYYASQKRDGILGTDCGSTLAGGLAAAKNDGSCPEKVMPYRLPYTGQFAPGCWEAAAGFKIRRHVVCTNYGDVFAFLASGQGGVEIGIRWPQELMRCNGIIERYNPGNSGGGHAICFLGYSKRQDSSGRNYLWMANSWGEEWGNRGWAEVAPQAVDQMSRHPDTVMIGLSDMKAARPRDVSWIGKGSVF